MNMRLFIVLIACLLFFSVTVTSQREEFHEKLTLRPLSADTTFAHFEFSFRRSYEENGIDEHYFELFPKRFAQMIFPTGVKELEVSLSQTFWRWREWGFPIESVPSGSQVTAWFNEEEPEDKFQKLCNSLSGLLCGSFNFIGPHNTASPCLSFTPVANATAYSPLDCLDSQRSRLKQPRKLDTLLKEYLKMETNDYNNTTTTTKDMNLRDNSRVYRAHLPRENVCTENLTPLLKLLPCRDQQGLSTLLNGVQAFSAKYSSIHLRLHPLPDVPNGRELVLSVSMVLNKSMKQVNAGESGQKRLLSFFSLFGKKKKNEEGDDIDSNKFPDACSLASTSSISIDVPNLEAEDNTADNSNIESVKLETTPNAPATEASSSRLLHRYDLLSLKKENSDIEVFVNKQRNIKSKLTSPLSFVTIQRHLTGYGQDRRGIQSFIRNDHPDNSVLVTYLETLSWRVHALLGSLKVETTHNDNVELFSYSLKDESLDSSFVKYVNFVPSLDRQRPMTLELVLLLPPMSTTIINFGFEISFLKFTEHPPDANRGYDIGCAALTLHNYSTLHTSTLASEQSENAVVIFTRNLIVASPTPDFSMPYNVITITSTVLALGFGFLIGNIHKFWQPKSTKELEENEVGFLRKLINKFRQNKET